MRAVKRNFFRLNHVVILGLFILLTGCKEQIVHNLTELEANKIAVRLHERLITPEKVRQADGRWAISVSSRQALSAIKVLNDTRHFRASSESRKSTGSIISSRDDQRFRHERSLSHEIEDTIRSLSGVLDVRVHLNLPAVDPLFGRKIDKEQQGSGSVLIVTTNTDRVGRSEIAALVAGASGLAQKRVSVLVHAADPGQFYGEVQALGNVSSSLRQRISSAPVLSLTLALLLIVLGVAALGYGFIKTRPLQSPGLAEQS